MNNLQEVQKQITEMIKSDYPNPIFKVVDHNKMIFQFDELSYNGEIEILEVPNQGIYLDGPYWSIYQHCETPEKFMNKFKEVYEEEQLQLIKYVKNNY